jgi:hypothetical protein
MQSIKYFYTKKSGKIHAGTGPKSASQQLSHKLLGDKVSPPGHAGGLGSRHPSDAGLAFGAE